MALARRVLCYLLLTPTWLNRNYWCDDALRAMHNMVATNFYCAVCFMALLDGTLKFSHWTASGRDGTRTWSASECLAVYVQWICDIIDFIICKSVTSSSRLYVLGCRPQSAIAVLMQLRHTGSIMPASWVILQCWILVLLSAGVQPATSPSVRCPNVFLIHVSMLIWTCWWVGFPFVCVCCLYVLRSCS